MKKVILVTLVLLMTFIGCSKTPNAETIKTENSAVSADSQILGSEQMDGLARYIEYIKNNKGIDENNTLLFHEKGDIDLDGYEEIVLAWGTEDEEVLFTNITDAYILRDDNGVIKVLGDNLVNEAYGTYEIKLVDMQADKSKYIYVGLSNGGPLIGFKLYKLQDNTPKSIVYSASATGSGDDYLVDTNSDNKFDGYVQNRRSYDVLYYPLMNHYDFINGEFELSSTDVDIPEYPKAIKDVILEYISLNVINTGKCSAIDERLAELCGGKDIGSKINSLDCYSAAFNTIMQFDNQIVFDINETDDSASAKITYKDDEDDKTYEYIFCLVKNKEKWTIQTIE